MSNERFSYLISRLCRTALIEVTTMHSAEVVKAQLLSKYVFANLCHIGRSLFCVDISPLTGHYVICSAVYNFSFSSSFLFLV